MGVAGIFGLVGGAFGGEAAVSYAGELGERLLQTPAIRAKVGQISAKQGVHLVTAVQLAGYYANRPAQFECILFQLASDKTVGGAAFETVKAIIAGIALGAVKDAFSQALAQPVASFIGAVNALEQKVESQLNAGQQG